MSKYRNDRECVKTKVYGVRDYIGHSQAYDDVVIDEDVLTTYKQAVLFIHSYKDYGCTNIGYLYHAISHLKECVKMNRDFMNAWIALSHVYTVLGIQAERDYALSQVYRISGVR